LVKDVSGQTLSRKFAQLEFICQEIEIEISSRNYLTTVLAKTLDSRCHDADQGFECVDLHEAKS
jgi:hypothetical protein